MPAMPHPRPVVVAGLWINGASVLRHLAGLGHPVVGISHRETDPGFASGKGDKRLCPDPLEEGDAWLEFMLELGREQERRPAHRPTLIPCSDEYVVAIDRQADRLGEHFRFHGFGDGLRTELTSKRHSFRLAEEHRFPMPASRFVADRDELADFAREVLAGDAEVLIKPDYPVTWRTGEAVSVTLGRKVMPADSLDGILALYDEIAPFTPAVLAQEVIPGPDPCLIYWCGFVRDDGRVGGRLVGRKVRLEPIRFGSASFVELLDRPAVEEECERFLGELRYRGLCGIELKEDPRDGVAKLIEVNPRWGLWDDIGIPVGVDLVREALSESPPEPHRARHFRQKWVALSLDASAFLDYRAEGEIGWAGWLWSLRPPIRVADMPLLSDPPYAWHFLRQMLRAAWGKLRGGGDPPSRPVEVEPR